MNKEELSRLVAELLQDMGKAPTVKASDYKPTEPNPQPAKEDHHPGDFVEDVTKIDLRKLYLQENAKDPEGFCRLKTKTPARLGSGRAGCRYKTLTLLRFRADHAAAQDTVFNYVDEEFVKRNNFVEVHTLCKDKDEYLTRPDLGRRFDSSQQEIIKKTCGENPKVLIVVGDGLSSAAVEANVEDMIPAIKQGLSNYGISVPDVLFVKHSRVGAMDAIGEVTNADVICILIGERPGLVTAQSMSAYITYKPKIGIPESKRTVISNIHSGGTTAVEAGAHTAELIKKMLDKKASGVDLKI